MYSRAYRTLVSAPPLLWVGLFLLLPYLLMFVHSFWLVRDGFLVHDWNLQNYHKLVSNPLYVEVLFRTMRIAASVTLLSLLLGYPLAYYLSFHAGARKELLYQLVIVPLWVSYLVRGYAWKTILGSDGVLNGFLQYIHITHEPVGFLLYSPFAVIVMLTHIYTPFVFLPIYASLEHIPRFSRAASCRRPKRNDDRQHRAKPVRRGLRVAARRCDFRLYSSDHHNAAFAHRTL
jgi:spermidine/putrescine transport system permease protein